MRVLPGIFYDTERKLSKVGYFQMKKTRSDSATTYDALILGTGLVAEFFGISDVTLGAWQKNGCPKLNRGRWDLKAVFEWWLENICQDQTGIDDSFAGVRKLYWGEKYRGEKFKNDIQEGKFAAWDLIEKEWIGRIVAVTSGLTSHGDRLPPLLEGRSRAEMREIILQEVIILRDAFARIGKYTPKGK